MNFSRLCLSRKDTTFISVIKFVSVELFIVLLDYPSNVYGILVMIHPFVSCLFSLALLQAYPFYWSFQETAFGPIVFSLLITCFQFPHWSLPSFVISFSCLLGVDCFSSFLRWLSKCLDFRSSFLIMCIQCCKIPSKA